MPYATGEIPVPGDYVKNDLEQPGTVTRLRMASNGDDFVSIRWDDGGVDSPLTPAKEFTLICQPTIRNAWRGISRGPKSFRDKS